MIEYNNLDNWESDSYIITNQAIGTVVSTERHTNANWDCMMFPVSNGDKIFISAHGGDDPRAVTILDDEYKLVYHSEAQAKLNKKLDIEQDGFVIVNNRKSTFTTPKVLHYPISQDNTDLGRVYTTHNHGGEETDDYQVTIGENVYPAVKIGNQLWTAKNLDENFGTIGVDEWYYGGRNIATKVVDYNSGSSTIHDNSISDNVGYFWDWETGERATLTTKVKSKLTAGLSLKCTLTFSEPLKSEQTVYYHLARIIDGEISYISNVRDIPAGTTTYTYDHKFAKSSIDYDVRSIIFRFGANKSNDGIIGNWSNINISYGYVDNVVTNITLPQALANEETAKANNYGRLYTWTNVNDNLSKLNLNGWRLPNSNDFTTLVNYCGGTNVAGSKLKSKSVGGEDTYGYNALLCGRIADNVFSSVGIYENALGDSYNTTTATTFDMSRNYTAAYVDHTYNKASTKTGRSVRLVLDIPEDGSLPDGTVRLEKTNQARNIGKGYIQDNNYQPGDLYKPYNRNIGTGAKPYIPNDNGKVYVDDVRCDIVCPHDKPETSETNSISLSSETNSEPIIEE